MNSLYSKFIKETLGWDCLEDEDSFVSYHIQKKDDSKCLKICEMFIDNKARGKDKSKDLLEKLKEIALNNDCNFIAAQISQDSSEFIKQRSIHICRLFGMNLFYEDSMVIIYNRRL
jgi:hypothetical protein